MTIEQAREKYGIPTDDGGHKAGYVYCNNCPLDDCSSNECPDYCSGYSDTWEAIAKYMTDHEVEPTAVASAVDHPSHYNQGGIECIDAMVAAFGKEAVENFCLINAFKYLWRSKEKNGYEDIDKAIWYLTYVKELTANDGCSKEV